MLFTGSITQLGTESMRFAEEPLEREILMVLNYICSFTQLIMFRAVEIMAIMKWAKVDISPVIILVRQFRPPLGKDTLEFPAGKIDDHSAYLEISAHCF